MAFKAPQPKGSSTESPSKLFQKLTRRQLPDVMTHQRDILDEYANNCVRFQ